MSQKPCIGVTTSRESGRTMWLFYWLSLRLFHVKPVRLMAPATGIDTVRFDGLIIGGGDDIGAEHYNGETTLDVRIDPDRDELELALLREAIPRGVPVLGVCRGAQMLNVSQGGSLHQDVRARYPEMPKMWTPLPRKRVFLREGTILKAIIGKDVLRVNSLHRQAIDRLGDRLAVSGRDEFGVIQAIEDPAASFRIGVQWHPEFLIYRGRHRRLFRDFVKAAKAFAERPHEGPP